MALYPHTVSLDDSDATRDELDRLRNVLRSDEPYPDEAPTETDWADFHRWKAVTDAAEALGIDLEPDPADRLWWAVETAPEFGEWGDVDLEPLPETTISGSWDLPNGQFGYTREEPQ